MNITPELVQQSLKELVASGKDTVSALKASRGPVAIAKALAVVVPDVVQHVESVSTTLGIKGADKKELACSILNAVIPWPFWIPSAFRMALLEGFIDMAVSVFNRFWKKKAA